LWWFNRRTVLLPRLSRLWSFRLGRKEVDGTEVLLPGKPKPGQRKRESAKRRAAIEPVISHLKHQHRLIRCFLKSFLGDQMNLLLATAAWNLKKWLRTAGLF
jgi:IS5 family transposase